MDGGEVIANLDLLIHTLEPKYLKPAMNKACAVVRNDAISNAPQRTGALKRSIDFEVSNNGSEGVIYSSLKYAPYVEVGTGIYSTKGGGRLYIDMHTYIRVSKNFHAQKYVLRHSSSNWKRRKSD